MLGEPDRKINQIIEYFSKSKSIQLRRAGTLDVEGIMNFIALHWDASHIFALNRAFFDYEFVESDSVNFFIAEDLESSDILGVQGFIDYGNAGGYRHICPVLSSVAGSCNVPFVGLALLAMVHRLPGATSFSGVGTNEDTMAPLLSEFFGRSLRPMMHYFSPINFDHSCFQDVDPPDSHCLVNQSNSWIRLTSVKETDLFDISPPARLIPKSSAFFQKRYFDHPIYDYSIFACSNKGGARGLCVVRLQESSFGRVLRLVDFYGDLNVLKDAIPNLINVGRDLRADYFDLLIAGCTSDFFKGTQMLNKSNFPAMVLPNYFEPLVLDNVKILSECSDPNFIQFRGDADGDRPRYARFY